MIRKIAIFVWASAALSALILYLLRPDFFSPREIAATLSDFQGEALICYAAISMLRGFTLLPSTPLIIVGTILFPQQPWTVVVISVLGIVVSSSLIYWFSDLLGFAEFFKKRRPEAVAKIRRRLEHPLGVVFVAVWAFFPIVPTDAVCYVSGSIKMNFAKFIAAVFVGELILCSFYVFSGSFIIWSLSH